MSIPAPAATAATRGCAGKTHLQRGVSCAAAAPVQRSVQEVSPVYRNYNVINKVLLSLSVICLSIAVYLAFALRFGAFAECAPVLAAPVFLCVLVCLYTPPLKTRTALTAALILSAAAAAIIIGVVFAYIPYSL